MCNMKNSTQYRNTGKERKWIAAFSFSLYSNYCLQKGSNCCANGMIVYE